MNGHTRKTYEKIVGEPAPRDLEWDSFVTLWEDIADRVEQESGDRLAVDMNGHREVFRRPHDGIVSIEDVEQARHLLAKTPDLKGSGHVLAVTVDAKGARILDFDLDTAKVEDTEKDVKDDDPRSRRLRTVEKKTGHDDVGDLDAFFTDLADALTPIVADRTFVVFGHGTGKSNVAELFVERLRDKHHDLAEKVVAVADIDLSAATDADIEAKTKQLAQGS